MNAAPLEARRSGLRAALPLDFYNRPTEIVARELLGATLECHSADGLTRVRIVETEAYVGEHDPACHAAAGLTPRTAALFGPPGRSYVYFIYGMYWCFNAVTRERGHGSAVLVRAAEPVDGAALMRRRRRKIRRDVDLTNGPGKLCQAMGITGEMSGRSLRAKPVIIRPDLDIGDSDVIVSPRIGITKAAEWPLRFHVRDNAFVSKTPRGFVANVFVNDPDREPW